MDLNESQSLNSNVKKKVLITGANGFIGKNLSLACAQKNIEVLSYDLSNKEEELQPMIDNCDFVYHLAGVNRPLTTEEFYDGNVNFTVKLIDLLKKTNRKIPLLISSSIHASMDNDYGKSKKMAEEAVIEYGKTTGSSVFVFRLANAFGKWCRPNYNSVIATFCYNVANNLEIKINDRNTVIPFVYIDDIVETFIGVLDKESTSEILSVEPVYHRSIGELADLLYSYKESRKNLMISDMMDGFVKKLYSTYLTYLPESDYSYFLKMNIDQRGSFSEFVKTVDRGQVSINISKPGIVKGNHWHHTKTEKFLVVSGTGVIRFRKIGETTVIEYPVSDEKLEVVDIPPGYTHNIENLGNQDLITVMWCNECFDTEHPDTFYEEV